MGNTESYTHKMVVHTGDLKGASARRVKFCVVFTDADGKTHTEDNAVHCGEGNFRKGTSKELGVHLADLGKISAIKIHRDDAGNKHDWFVDRIEVFQLVSEQTDFEEADTINQSIFPMNRWINDGQSLSLVEYDSSLPQEEINSEQREAELIDKRQTYILSGKILGAPPQVEILPKDEEFSFDYQFKLFGSGLHSKIDSIRINLTNPRFESLSDYEAIYEGSHYSTPKGMSEWKCDVAFGQQKLAGINPVIIELCTKIPDHLAVTPDLVAPYLEGKTLEDALTSNKMFIIDLSYMANIECSEGRKLPGPTCLFYQRDSGDLVPIAIQLMPEPAEDNPVFTPPTDPNEVDYTWLAAKMWFNLADCSHHQSATHLGFTHLLMESVAVCTNRRLSLSHPIYKLLAPHFLYILAINSLAIAELVQPGGWVDTAMQIGRVGLFNIVRKNWAEWNLKEDGNFMNNLKRRGVDGDVLPTYHYRDDAKLLWEAINKYVATVVNGVYDSPEKLSGDSEILAWCKDMSLSANIKGVPAELSSNEDLIEMVTVFIFISSVGHAAANFGQYDQYGFTPNYPASLHSERPTTKAPLTEEYVVSALPSKKQTTDVMEITRILSMKGTNSLGYFEVQYAYDPLSLQALNQFQADLKSISEEIKERNTNRKTKYEYLNPEDVPNAISI